MAVIHSGVAREETVNRDTPLSVVGSVVIWGLSLCPR
jgi:hypothetical protein